LGFMQACSAQIDGIPCDVSRSGYTGEDGFEISLPKTRAEQLARLFLDNERVEAIGLGARDTLRLEAGLCLYGHELNETISPIEARLHWVFKKAHAEFPGAATILKQKEHGPARVRIGLLVEGKIPVRDGCQLVNGNDEPVGYVSSGGFSPSLNRPIAMALVHPDVSALNTDLFAIVREKRINLSVCRLPFIPHRYRR